MFRFSDGIKILVIQKEMRRAKLFSVLLPSGTGITYIPTLFPNVVLLAKRMTWFSSKHVTYATTGRPCKIVVPHQNGLYLKLITTNYIKLQ